MPEGYFHDPMDADNPMYARLSKSLNIGTGRILCASNPTKLLPEVNEIGLTAKDVLPCRCPAHDLVISMHDRRCPSCGWTPDTPAYDYNPRLAYGAPDQDHWKVIDKPIGCFFCDVDYVLGMGRVPFKIQRRRIRRAPANPGVTVPVVMVPTGYKGRAEWLLQEYVAAEAYQHEQVVKTYIAGLKDLARHMDSAACGAGYKVVYCGRTGSYSVWDNDIEIEG